jgi:DNA-binding MarR family transcriptional regulator
MAEAAHEASQLPLSALLSQVLVAFTIECDNEFERQMPHRTSNYGSKAGGGAGPWLVSMAMWWTCMRFVGADGITVAELIRRARTGTNLPGLLRWGYISVEPDPADTRPRPPPSDWVIHATRAGRQAQEVWRPLTGVIEARWATRFGENEIASLREALQAIAVQLDPALPDCLPILGYGLFSAPGDGPRPTPQPRPDPDPRPATQPVPPSDDLPALLSRVLLALAIEFERDSPLSLAICADVLRVLDGDGVRVRDLPALSGVSKEAISMATGILDKRGLAVTGPAPDGGRWRVARLTAKGRSAQNKYRERLSAVEDRWQARFGAPALSAMREGLEQLTGDHARLVAGLEPPPGGWRASVRRPATLPHYPMLLHRGGFPDGS